MNTLYLPAFRDPHGYGETREENLNRRAAKRTGQRPRLFQLTHSCGTTLPYVREVYSEAGETALRAEYAKKPCGMCSDCYAADRNLTRRNEDDRWRDEYRRGLER